MKKINLPYLILLISTSVLLGLSSCGKQNDIDKYIGNYDVFEECDVTFDWNYTIEITEANSNDDNIIIKNFGDFSKDVPASVDGDMIFYDFSEDDFSISGTGELNGNALTLYYSSSDPSLTSNCTAYCTKQ